MTNLVKYYTNYIKQIANDSIYIGLQITEKGVQGITEDFNDYNVYERLQSESGRSQTAD